MIRNTVFAAIGCALALPALANQAVAVIADLRANAQVNVTGTVARVLDYDTFVLRDGTGSIPVYVGERRHGLAVGQTVTVSGRVDDDWPREIYATSVR
jgi:uncharacterized protein YdeI (BOF family)